VHVLSVLLVAKFNPAPKWGSFFALNFSSTLPLILVMCIVQHAGASEPRNMGYMERLGLWGAGNPAFSNFADFMDAVGSRGVCALELVAMDMKAQGMYVARTLSYAGAPLHAAGDSSVTT